MRSVAGRARSLVCLASLASLGAAAACDPCFGTNACSSTPARLVIDGQIVNPQDGRGVDGIRVDVVRVGGASLESDTVSSVTSGGGFWHVSTNAMSTGNVIADVHVESSLMTHGYVVHALQVPLVTRAGDAYLTSRWVTELYFPYSIQFYRRGQPSQFFPSVPVTFHQTGGAPLRGVADSIVHTSTDTYGYAQMFLYSAFASDTGPVIGDATLQLPTPPGPVTVHGLAVYPTYVYRAQTIQRPVGVGPGPSLQYALPIVERATGRLRPDLLVTISRVGGVNTVPTSMGIVSDDSGYVNLQLVPLESGSLIADITIYPAAGGPETYRDTIPTFDADGTRLLPRLNAGPAFPYYGTVVASGAGVAGVSVRVRQTAGIEITPVDTTVTTLPDGTFPLKPFPYGTGSVTLELTFKPPAPHPAFVVSNVVISTFQRDTSINIWNWDLDHGISGPPGTKVTALP